MMGTEDYPGETAEDVLDLHFDITAAYLALYALREGDWLGYGAGEAFGEPAAFFVSLACPPDARYSAAH